MSDSREGIIAVPLPPLPSADSSAQQAPDGTPHDGASGNGAHAAPGVPPAGSVEPEGTDSEEVPLSPADEDVMRQRREPGRGNATGDSGPLRPDGNGQGSSNPTPQSHGDRAPDTPNVERSGTDTAGQTAPDTKSKEPNANSTNSTPGLVKPFTATGLKAGSDPSSDRSDPVGNAPTGEADRGGAVAPAVPLPSQIAYGDEGLPGPVRDLRTKLMEIARTGDIEKLRPYLQGGEDATVLSFGDAPEDPIAFLKDASGDGQGVEMLAILLEVLQAGHAHVEPGDADEIYVWPYFTQVQIDTLTKPQMVQLFELVTAGDYEAMKAFGAYNFFRVGISPDGKLEFFVAGD